ncbi:MAG: RNA polymerase sigma factor [Deltaproteobacteria bacterium]|nr:MAG: RNA polymerase sigma factor [Deltaproteobacteria bacterium]
MGKLKLLSTHHALPEDDEIKRIAETDPAQAIDLVVRRYRDRIYNHAAYILKDHAEAVDVTQEVFIKAMRERRFFDPGFKMKAWLFRVTSNMCFNMVRDRKRRRGLLEKHPPPRSIAANQVEVVYADERQQQIGEAIQTLTENHREILELRYYGDLSYAEIADALGIKLGTVMSRLSRARNKLTEALEGSGVVPE